MGTLTRAFGIVTRAGRVTTAKHGEAPLKSNSLKMVDELRWSIFQQHSKFALHPENSGWGVDNSRVAPPTPALAATPPLVLPLPIFWVRPQEPLPRHLV